MVSGSFTTHKHNSNVKLYGKNYKQRTKEHTEIHLCHIY